MSGVRLNVTRACWFKDAEVRAGTVLDVDENDALQLLEAGRAELIDQRDWPKIQAFARAELHKVMQQASRGTASTSGTPWIEWPR